MSKTLLHSFQELLWWESKDFGAMIKGLYQEVSWGKEITPKQAKVLSWRVGLTDITDFPWDQIKVRPLTPEDLLGEDVRVAEHFLKFFTEEEIARVTGQLEEGKKSGKRHPVFIRMIEEVPND